MPVAQQNALVGKYCAVCHTDAIPNGGLSLQHFDAARPDPGLMAMIVSKLKSKALGASGQPLPDKATQDLFQSTLAVSSFGAERWVVDRHARDYSPRMWLQPRLRRRARESLICSG